MQPEDLATYTRAFVDKLGDLVGRQFGMPQMMGVVKASSLYPVELQVMAAQVGHSQKLPHEAAIAFFVVAEAIRYESQNSGLTRLLPGKARSGYKDHSKVVESVGGIMKLYEGSSAPGDRQNS